MQFLTEDIKAYATKERSDPQYIKVRNTSWTYIKSLYLASCKKLSTHSAMYHIVTWQSEQNPVLIKYSDYNVFESHIFIFLVTQGDQQFKWTLALNTIGRQGKFMY